MNESLEQKMAARFARLTEIRQSLDELEERRKMFSKSLDVHHIPEIAEQIDGIDQEIEALKSEEAKLLN
jgi:hypothetical protein